MGHGAAREVGKSDEVERELGAELAAKLDSALERVDRNNAKFKAARDEERFAQTTKAWHRKCAEVDSALRTVAKVLIQSHQLNLDIGSDGGGVKARPWIEEMGGAFDRLWFRLEGVNVIASSGNRVVGTLRLKDVTYEWVEQMVVGWVVGAADSAGAVVAAAPARR